LPWLEAQENSDHVLWIRWNRGDRLGFLQRWEKALAILDSQHLVESEIVLMLRNPDQFLDTMAQVEVASILSTKGFHIELESKKSGKTPDIYMIREAVCIEVKNLHMDAVLLEQAVTGKAKVVWLKDRLPSAVEEKYAQLPDGYPNILVVVSPPEIQFDEFEDLFIDVSTTIYVETGEIMHGSPKGLFYQERVDGRKIYAKISAAVMWKDHVRRYLLNPSAEYAVSEQLLQKVTS